MIALLQDGFILSGNRKDSTSQYGVLMSVHMGVSKNQGALSMDPKE